MANKRFQVAFCDGDGVVIFDTPTPSYKQVTENSYYQFDTLAEACKKAKMRMGYRIREVSTPDGTTLQATKVPVRFVTFFDTLTYGLYNVDVTLDHYEVRFFNLTPSGANPLSFRKESFTFGKKATSFSEAMSHVESTKTGFTFPNGYQEPPVELEVHRVLIGNFSSSEIMLATMTDAWTRNMPNGGM